MEEQTTKPETKISYAQFLLPGAILIAAVIISATLVFTRNQGGQNTAQIGSVPQGQTKPVDIKINSDDHILGNKDAKITIIEYSDFECSFCRKFWSETLSRIEKEFIDSGKARFIYRHFPLQFHSGAKPAALATECAAEQGKFWQMHDEIYKRQGSQDQNAQLTKENLKKWAAAIGLDTAKFNQCLDDEKYSKKINDDLASGQAAGVTGTPAFFVNGTKIVGAQPYENFKSVIDGLLK